ncbi:MAG: hypothetical protein QOK38_4098 [Acidobacteriaceae bacterium]|nr:hypothetical protein [Acidobacteriaceae bacterium]
MSALRRQKEPLTTADIANQQRAGRTRGDAVVDETDIDPADRRPPQSAVARSAATDDTATEDTDDTDTDDTYDGEIVNSSVEPAPSANNVSTVPPSAARSGTGPKTPKQPAVSAGESAASQSTAAGSQTNGRHESPLFAENELRDFRARWDQVQTSFVDEPRQAVEQADTLVATVVKRIAEQFAEERSKLEKQWDRGDNVSTEDLRQGFKRYRAFFDRLLSV